MARVLRIAARVLALCLACWCSTSGARARADCEWLPLELLWSYPAEAQTNVPLNASFWVLANHGDQTPRAAAWLNGREVKRLERDERNAQLGLAAFAPVVLEPNTQYTLRVAYEASADHAAKAFELHFTTGTERRDQVAAAKIGDHRRRAAAYFEDHPCKKLIMALVCPDTTDASFDLHTLELAQPGAIGWYVKADGPDPGRFWPAVCGSPTLALQDLEGSRCFAFQALAVGGAPIASKRVCPREKASRVQFDRTSAPDYTEPPGEVPEERRLEPAPVPPAAATAQDAPNLPKAKSEGCSGCAAAPGAPAPLALCAILVLLAVRKRTR